MSPVLLAWLTVVGILLLLALGAAAAAAVHAHLHPDPLEAQQPRIRPVGRLE